MSTLDPEKRDSDNVVLGGVPWTILQAKLQDTIWGLTHHDDRLIELSPALRGKTKLDTTIHECLHAIYPWMREWAVEQTASEIADILWMLGYRKVKK